MKPSSTSSDGIWPCPNGGFYCCPDGEVGNKGIAHLISHLKRLHLSIDERKCVVRETISTDHELYMAVEETLKVFGQWLCGKCMTLHAVGRACYHSDGLIRFSNGSNDMSGYIVGISKPSNTESKTEVIEGLVLDAELMDHVFKVPVTTVKCISHGCRLTFSQVLKTVLYNVVSHPNYVDAWVRQCLRKVADGDFMAIVKVLSSSSVAPYCDDTIKALEAKHPYKPPPSRPSNIFSPYLLKVITSVVNLWLTGKCPPILAEFVASAPVTPLFKPDTEIQPVEVSTIWRRLLSEYHNDRSLAMLTVDISNVFNLVDRSTLLHEVKVRPSLGVKLLRGAVSRDIDFISGMTMRRAVNAVDLISFLSQLHAPHCELLLLRSCMGISKLFFDLKTCQPVHVKEATLFFDKGLRRSIENIVVCGGPFFGDLQWQLASLPIRLDGFGLYSEKVASTYAFVVSRAQSWVLQDHILHDSDICGMDDDYVYPLACLRDTIPSFDFSCLTNKDTVPSKAQQTLASVLFSEMVKDMEVHFDMTVRQNAPFECLRALHAQDFLLAIPIDGTDQHMSPLEYRTILKRAEISTMKEALVNFLIDPRDERSTLRSTDVLIFGWVGGKHACVDLTGVSPLVGLSSRGFTVGQAAVKAASCKVTKHEKASIENQHVFISFAFDTFDFLAFEAMKILNRIQRVMNTNVMTPKSTNVVFHRISFAIGKRASDAAFQSSDQQSPSYTQFVVNATQIPIQDTYDYIIVGGGTAGCPLAATLSKNYRVLLLERGGLPTTSPNVMTRE
nr:putative reverse transcriptase domain-containing protein [Tanacetum cinerariifolium]